MRKIGQSVLHNAAAARSRRKKLEINVDRKENYEKNGLRAHQQQGKRAMGRKRGGVSLVRALRTKVPRRRYGDRGAATDCCAASLWHQWSSSLPACEVPR